MVLVSRTKTAKKKPNHLPHQTSDIQDERKGKQKQRSILKFLLGADTTLTRLSAFLMLVANVYVYFFKTIPTECDEMSSFARWHQYTYPSNELEVDTENFVPPMSSTERSKRFPSVQQRIEYYMGQWYEPDLQDMPRSSPFGAHWEERYRSSSAAHHTHDPLVNPLGMDPDLLHQCSVEYHEHARDDPKLASACAYHGNDYVVTVGKYARDTVGAALLAREFYERTFLSHWWQVLKYEGAMGLLMEFVTPKLPRSAKPAYLFHYGPAVSEASTQWNTQTPVFGRVRNVVAEKDGLRQSYNHTSLHSTIIWPLDRYFDKICQAPKRDSDLAMKENGGNRVYWRGNADLGTRREWTNKFKDAAEIDVKHSSVDPFINRVLEHKYILVLEGLDSSDELWWKIFGDSVVFMPEPTHVSWGMETLLIPFVHYVPVTVDNVEDRLKWARAHPDEITKIRKASTLWVWDLYFHPQAIKDEEEILRTMIHRYHQFVLRGKPLSIW